GAQRRAVANALGHRHQLGRHAPVLEAPELRARSPEAGLHFVGDAHAAMTAHDVVDDAELLRRRRDDPAGTLDRLGDKARDLARRFITDQLLHILSTFHVAARILQAVGTAVAIARRRVLEVDRRVAATLPCDVSGHTHAG